MEKAEVIRKSVDARIAYARMVDSTFKTRSDLLHELGEKDAMCSSVQADNITVREQNAQMQHYREKSTEVRTYSMRAMYT